MAVNQVHADETEALHSHVPCDSYDSACDDNACGGTGFQYEYEEAAALAVEVEVEPFLNWPPQICKQMHFL